MNNFLKLLFILLFNNVEIHLINAQDNIFAKGGTCLYKISNHWRDCMDQQNARLQQERDYLEPIFTRAKLVDSVNRISCCAYWEFLSCIERAANQHCPNEKHDMVAYSRQLGSAVPVDICRSQFPPDSAECNGSFTPVLFSFTLAFILFIGQLFLIII